MIDGSLTFQFFSRHNLTTYEGDHNTEFYYSKDYKYEVNQYSFSQNSKYINFFYRNPNFVNVIKLQESNEGTFINFYKNFLLKRKTITLAQTLYSLNLNPLEIYAQLISIIKGSYTSHLYMNNCISKEDYKSKGRKITDLPNLDDIYDVCMLYEDYKKGKYFDIQDLVNFLIRQVKLEFKNVKLIDYLFIDEIQDLSISQIYLLILVSKYCKVYAGDTCQTISKINRFRFSELSNIFYNFSKIIPNYPKVNNAYLCLNYRLNSKILRLSTFMAYLMKLLFPNTIDKFQDDFSIKVIEQKPIILHDINLIINNIKNNSKNGKNDYTLAANHCFIYRDEEDGIKLNTLYGENIYKLNVEQSKGLEFEIVIAFNFFSSSKFQGLWQKIFSKLDGGINGNINSSAKLQFTSILFKENIEILMETLNLKQFYLSLEAIQEQLIQEDKLKENNLEEKEEVYEENKENKVIRNLIINELDNFVYPNDLNSNYDKHEIFEFCSELKQFYVVITRPKTFLVFYETNLNKNRNQFYEFMKSENIKLIEEDNNKNSQSNFLYEVSEYFQKIKLTVNSPEELIKLGNNEFNEAHYLRAIYLYKKGKNKFLTLISEIFNNEELLNQEINKNNENSSINHLNTKIVDDISKTLEIYEKSKNNLSGIIGDETNKINILKVVGKLMDFKGRSLVLLKKYDEAIECYKNHNDNKKYELGKIYYKYKKSYKMAFQCFDSIKNYKYALKSLKKIKDYEYLFNYTNKIANYLGMINYNEIYIEFINFYFRKYFFERKNINEEFNIRQFKNNKTYKQIIINFFEEYMNQIQKLESFEKANIKIREVGNFFEKVEKNNKLKDEFEELQDELKIDLDTTHFVYLYYFNKPKNLLYELIKIYPELIYFKSNIFVKEDYIEKLRIYKYLNLLDREKNYKKKEEKKSIAFTNRNIYYENMLNIITKMILQNM